MTAPTQASGEGGHENKQSKKKKSQRNKRIEQVKGGIKKSKHSEEGGQHRGKGFSDGSEWLPKKKNKKKSEAKQQKRNARRLAKKEVSEKDSET
ncbi:hypothetical protein CYMTET_50171 [Cymbomonas tetramitiformis]|uniref:Uncharacterized protein n=1 Tax=Cymbomonas tetramitiformis TaxID=36881 RepID=A0AAE0BPZ8_9CHLO|nr:hypothetical protein CYMTET_50171 [Cymbomonas tetramitiformis]